MRRVALPFRGAAIGFFFKGRSDQQEKSKCISPTCSRLPPRLQMVRRAARCPRLDILATATSASDKGAWEGDPLLTAHTSFTLPIIHWQTTFHDSYSQLQVYLDNLWQEGTWRGARAPSWTLSGDYLGLLTPRTGRLWSCSMSLDTSRSIHFTMHTHNTAYTLGLGTLLGTTWAHRLPPARAHLCVLCTYFSSLRFITYGKPCSRRNHLDEGKYPCTLTPYIP